MSYSFRVIVAGLILFTPLSLRAGDWPQILGPQRNGIAVQEKLAESWPDSGPHKVWEQSVDNGLAGPAVVADRVVLFHRIEDEDVAVAFDAKTGKQIWQKRFPATYRASYNPDDGPRCVPLIHDGYVYLFGANGDLRSLALKDGQQRWVRHTHRDFKAREGYFGAGSSPMIVAGKLLVNVGGRDESAVVAFALEDGKTVWQAFDDAASYSSPVTAQVGDTTHALFVTRFHVVSLDPHNGAVRFQFPFGRRGPTVNGASPVVVGDQLFVSSHYRVGAVFAKIGKDFARQVWANDETLSIHYATPIHHEGYLYGLHGQERATPIHLRCVEMKTGKQMWSRDNFGSGTLIFADGKLLITTLDGELVLVQPSPKEYLELARSRVSDSPTRPLPALADSKLYLRNERELRCLDMGK